MKHYGLEMKGIFKGEILATQPAWSPSDEARWIYTQDTNEYYFGDSTGWVDLAVAGSSGSSGSSGTSGVAGTSGSSGTSGVGGTSGSSGSSGTSGAGGGSGLPLIIPNDCSLDDTDTDVSRGSAYNMIETIDFGTTSDGAVWFTFQFPSTLDDAVDIKMDIFYNLSGSDDSKIVTMQTKYWVYGDGTTPNPASPTGTNSSGISTGTSEDGKRQSYTLDPIPNASLTAGYTITLKFTRLSSDTYSGSFQMFYVYIYQD